MNFPVGYRSTSNFHALPTDYFVMNSQVYKLPTDRIYATYFGGDEESGLAADNESKNIWLKYLPEEKVLPFGCKVLCIFLVCWSNHLLMQDIRRTCYFCSTFLYFNWSSFSMSPTIWLHYCIYILTLSFSILDKQFTSIA